MLTIIIPCISKSGNNFKKIINTVEPLDYVKRIYVSSPKDLFYDGASEKVELIKCDGTDYNSEIVKCAVKKADTEYVAIIPDSFLLSKSCIDFAYKSQLQRPEGMTVIGLEDNVVNPDRAERYTPYKVYDNKIKPQDHKYCCFYKTTNLFLLEEDPSASELNSHFITMYMQKNTVDRNEKVSFVVNERFEYDDDLQYSFSGSYLHDRKIAKDLALVRFKKLGFLQRLFSITYFEGYNYFNFLGLSVKFKIRHKPVFGDDCHNYSFAKDIKCFNKRRACIFASFTRHGFTTEETLHYLRELKEQVDYLVFVADSKAKDETINAIEKIADALIIGRHEEYDFGSYKRGFELLDRLGILNNIDDLLICNDSVDFVGSQYDLNNIFNMAKSYDAYGICTATYGFGDKIKRHKYEWIKSPHVQSYFVTLSKKVFTSCEFKKAIYSIKKIKHKTDIIRLYEMGLTRFLDKHGFTHGSYYPYDDTCVVNPYAIYLNDGVEHPIFVKHMLKK